MEKESHWQGEFAEMEPKERNLSDAGQATIEGHGQDHLVSIL